MALTPALTRIKNNQITDNTIIASSKIVPGTVTGGLLSDPLTYSGNVSITGNLSVQGTTTTIDTVNSVVADPLVVLNRNAAGANSYDIGFIFERGASTNTAFIWDEANDRFALLSTTEVGTTQGSINNSGYLDLRIANLVASGTSSTFGNIQIGQNTIASTNTNGNINLTPNGTGEVVAASLSVSDLTSGRFALIGASGAFVDDGGITYSGNNITFGGNLAVNGGDITTTQTTATVFNANATTLSVGNAATTTYVGASAGNVIFGGDIQLGGNDIRESGGNVAISLNNTNVTVAGDLAVNDGDITTTQTTATVFNANATTLSVGNAATTLYIGGAGNVITGGDLQITGNDIRSSTGNAAITLNDKDVTVAGNASVTLDLAVNGGDITTTSATATVFNANATTLSVGNAATTLYIGGAGNVITGGDLQITGNDIRSSTGNVAITLNDIDANIAGNLKVADDLAVNGGDITTTQTTATIFNANATTLSVGNAATTLYIGGAGNVITGGDLQLGGNDIRESGGNVAITLNDVNVTVAGDLAVNGGDITTTQTTATVFNANATTLSVGNAATTLYIGGAGNVITGGDLQITGNDIRSSTGNVAITLNDTDVTVAGNSTVTLDLAVNGGDITTTSATATVFNANATTLSVGNAATTLYLGNSSGNVLVGGDIRIGGDSIRSSTGNIAMQLNDKDVTVLGNLTVQGTRTEVGTSDLVVSDSLINLHTPANLAPLTADDGRDIGLVLHYYKSGTDKFAFFGWANDTGELEYYSEGIESNVGTFSGQYGTIKANIFRSMVPTGTAPFVVSSTTQVANLNVAAAGSLINGTSNVSIPSANGNINLSVDSNANVLVVTGTGANITGTANVSGNANVGNLGTATAIITTGNITTINSGLLQNGTSNVTLATNGNVSTFIGGNATAQFVVTSTGANIAGTANVVGNLDAGNINTATAIITTGNITTINSGLMQNGNSNVTITANGNVSTSVAGNTNILVVTGTGANIAGTANVTGNLDAGNISTNVAVITTGNITTINSGLLQNGTSNVAVNNNGNVNISVGGTANVLTVTSTGANISGTLNTGTGNANVGNLGTATAIITTGNITTINGGLMQNGNSNVAITANGNITLTSTSNATLVISGTGANIAGTANVTGNIDAGANINTTASTVNLANATATTINFGGAATAINMGIATGQTTLLGNLSVSNNFVVTANSDLANLRIVNTTISSTTTNGNINISPNGTGAIVLNSGGDDSNVIIKGNTTSGYNNLIYADAVNGRVGILTDTVPAGSVLKVNANSSVILPVGNTATRPSPEVEGMLRYNTTISTYEFWDGSQWQTTGSSFTIISVDAFSGDGSTLAFTLSQNTTTAGVIVAINGIVQQPTTAYTVSGTTLTFTEAPLTGDEIDARVITTTSTVEEIAAGDSSVSVSDTGSNGTVTLTADGVARVIANTAVNITGAVVPVTSGTSVGTSATTIDTFDMSVYRSARYYIQASHASAGYDVRECLVVHDGSTAYITTYGVTFTGAATLGTTTVTTSSGNVNLQFTGANSANTVKVHKEYIRV